MNYLHESYQLCCYNLTAYTLTHWDICRNTPDCKWTLLYDYSLLRPDIRLVQLFYTLYA
jgi:hypothetical protein